VDELDVLFRDRGLTFTPIGHATVDRSVALRGLRGGPLPLPGHAWRHAPEATT
jgi:hypothetical protein